MFLKLGVGALSAVAPADLFLPCHLEDRGEGGGEGLRGEGGQGVEE